MNKKQLERNNIKLYLFTDNMILHVESPKYSTQESNTSKQIQQSIRTQS